MHREPEPPGLSAAVLRALRADQPSQRELTIAYQRFARRPPRRAPTLVVSRWLLAGLAMGLGIAFGAEAIVQQIPKTARETRPAPPPSTLTNTVQNRWTAPLPLRALSADPPPVVVEEKRPVPPRAVTPHAPAINESDPLPTDSAAWTKAAQGLRNKDRGQTEAALATLEHSGSLADREAARLIRAQLTLHQGDAISARALLQELANSAQSPLVRAKARRLLAQSANPPNLPLNVAPSGT